MSDVGPFYTHEVYATSRLIVQDEDGTEVELPRDHPVHVQWREHMNRTLAAAMVVRTREEHGDA